MNCLIHESKNREMRTLHQLNWKQVFASIIWLYRVKMKFIFYTKALSTTLNAVILSRIIEIDL
jgi:hypothetical protein